CFGSPSNANPSRPGSSSGASVNFLTAIISPTSSSFTDASHSYWQSTPSQDSRCGGLERFHFFDFPGGVAVALDGHPLDSLPDERFDVQCAIRTVELLAKRAQRVVARQKERAAVVKRLGGDVVRADFAGGIHN